MRSYFRGESRNRDAKDAPNLAFNIPAQIGAAIFIVQFVVVVVILGGFLYYDNQWREHLTYLVLGFLVIFGPILLGIAWVTRCTLRRFQIYRIGKKGPTSSQ
jgi:hypothetical protein